MASTTKSVSDGFTAALMAVISCIIASSTARRPAVSTITTLQSCWRAYRMRVFGDLHRVHVALLGVDLHADLSAQHLQLVDGRGTVNVAGDQQHLTALLAL